MLFLSEQCGLAFLSVCIRAERVFSLDIKCNVFCVTATWFSFPLSTGPLSPKLLRIDQAQLYEENIQGCA